MYWKNKGIVKITGMAVYFIKPGAAALFIISSNLAL
jgi:hypothetical protein